MSNLKIELENLQAEVARIQARHDAILERLGEMRARAKGGSVTPLEVCDAIVAVAVKHRAVDPAPVQFSWPRGGSTEGENGRCVR